MTTPTNRDALTSPPEIDRAAQFEQAVADRATQRGVSVRTARADLIAGALDYLHRNTPVSAVRAQLADAARAVAAALADESLDLRDNADSRDRTATNLVLDGAETDAWVENQAIYAATDRATAASLDAVSQAIAPAVAETPEAVAAAPSTATASPELHEAEQAAAGPSLGPGGLRPTAHAVTTRPEQARPSHRTQPRDAVGFSPRGWTR